MEKLTCESENKDDKDT